MKKILVVDDDPVIRGLVTNLTTREGYKVLTANDGTEGLSKFKNFQPDLIISDVLMPEMDGYELCKEIRNLPEGRQVSFLMLTSLDSVEQKIRGFDAGADDYIIKPFDPREFLARVGILIKRSELARQTPTTEKVLGKTIAVFSLRGGSGVSSIATNLAIGFSQLWNRSTTLVDMVIAGGQSALYLNLPSKNTWAEIVKFPQEEIDDYLVQSALVPHDSGVNILASPRLPELGELVTPEKASHVLSLLKEFNEYLVLDLPHDLNPTTLAALDMADVKLVVLQPEVVSIRSAVMTLRLFTDLGYDMDQVYLILNWTFPRNGFSVADIERSLQKKITMMLPYASDEMVSAINFGIPPTFGDPTKPLGVLFEDFALGLSKQEHRQTKPENPTDSWLRAVKRYRDRRSQK